MPEKKRRGVTPKNAEGKRTFPSGAFESALLILRKAFLHETIGGLEDTAFWVPIEEKATMSSRQACFQYNMIGINHMKLAEMCVDYFPAIKTGFKLGDISKEQRQNYITRASHYFLDEYPPKYQEKIRNESS